MRKLLLFFATMLISICSFATTYYWVGGASATFGAVGTLSTTLGGTGNASSYTGMNTTGNPDIFIFDGTDISSTAGLQIGAISLTLPSGAATYYAQMIFQNGVIVNTTAGGTRVLNIQGASGIDFIVNSGCTLTTNGSTTTIAIASTATGEVSGTVTIGSGTNAMTITSGSVGGLTFKSGSVCNANHGSGGPFGTSGTNGGVVFESGSQYNQKSTSGNPFQLTAPNSLVVFNSGSTFSQDVSAAPSMTGRTYGNFIWNNTGTQTLTGGTVCVIQNNLTISAAGILNLNLTAGINIGGNIAVNAGTLSFSPASAAAINFNGSAAQTISNSGTLTWGSNANIVVSNSDATNGVKFLYAPTILGTTTINAGSKLRIGAATSAFNGGVTVNGTFQIDQAGYATGTFSYAATGSTLAWNNSSGVYGPVSGHSYWPSTNSPYNVSVLNTGGVDFGSITRTINGTFTYNATISNYCSVSYLGPIVRTGAGSPNPLACGTFPTYLVHQSSVTTVSNPCSGSGSYWNITPTVGSALVLQWNIENKLSWTNTGIYYTTDGSTPSGSRGVGFGTTQFIAGSWICTDGSNREIATGTIPAIVNTSGTTVKYKIGAWNNGATTNSEAFATTTYATQIQLGNVYTYSLTCTSGTWLGTTNTDWNTTTNWSCGVIPTSAIDITIPNTVNKPSINSATTANVKSLTINSGATVTMNGGNLNIASGGSLINNGTFTTAAAVCSGTVTFAGGGTITGDCTFPDLTFSGTVAAVICNSNVSIKGNLTEAFQHTNTDNKSFIFSGDCNNDQTLTRTGGGTIYFKSIIINKPTANFVILSASPVTNVSIDDPLINNASGTTLTINNTGGLDINGQTFTINGGGGGGAAPRAAILVDGTAGSITKTIKSSVSDGTFNIRGTFVSGAGVEVNSANSGKLLFDNYVNVNTNIGFAPTDVTTIAYKLELLGVSFYNGGFIADINNTNSVNGHPVYGIGSTLIYNNIVGAPYDRNREWDASGVQTTGVTPGYPYNVLIKGNSKVDIGINTTSGIDNRAVANDLTIEAGSALDMNVMDQTNNHLTVGRDISFAGKLILGHGTTSNNPFVGDILVGRNWTRTGSTSIFDPNETGTGYAAANTQSVISDVTTNIKARAVTFFGTDASIIKAPRNTTRDINGVFGGETFPYLKLDKTNTANTLTNDTSSIAITRELFLSKGTLNLGDSNIVIVSNLYRTADIAQIVTPSNVAINYDNNGRFSLQRFIYNQSTQRSWRYLTAPLQASDPLTINNAWQEGAVNSTKATPDANNPWPAKVGSWCGLSSWPGFGTHITNTTGTYDGANGFDDGTNGASLKWYDNTAGTTVWGYPSSTTNTPLMSKLAWVVFIRGDRSFVIGDQYVPASTTILEPRGKINIGDVTSTVLSGKNNLIGNPYASQINMTNVSVGGVTNKNFKLWDPKAFTNYTNTGKYIPFTWISGTTYTASESPVTVWANPGTVESGEAFLSDNVLTNSVVFHETDKVPGISSLNGIQSRPARGNRPTGGVISFFRVNLAFYNSTESAYTSIDGTLNLYNPSYNTAVDKNEDVVSAISNSTGAIRIAKDGFQLSISKEATINNVDTIFLALSPLQKISHQLILSSIDFVPNVMATLEDKYLNTSTPITIGNADTTFYPFDVTEDVQSNRTDRFMIVLRPLTTTPVKFIHVKASQQVAGVLVEWNVNNELNTKSYTIERSVDGYNFMTINTIAVENNNNGNYSFLDTKPIGDIKYYRIIRTDQTGAKEYSAIIKIKSIYEEGTITLNTNPINNGVVEVQIKNMPKGNYQFRLLNSLGQKILSHRINIDSGNYSNNVLIGSIKSKGVYQLEIIKPDLTKSNIKVVY